MPNKYLPRPSVNQAQKLFKRKASPDASMAPKQFLKKKINKLFKKR